MPEQLEFLKPCEGFSGGTTVLASDPELAEVADVIYSPMIDGSPSANETHPWGLYREDSSVIMDAVDTVGLGRVVKKRNLAFDLAAAGTPVRHPETGGRYFYGGMVKLHYGHFIANTLSRLWEFARLKLEPNDRIVFHSFCRPRIWFNRSFIRETLNALGIAEQNVILWHRPNRISRLTVPHTSFSEQHSVHQVYGELCKLIGQKVLGPEPFVQNTTPVYLSKSALEAGVGRIENETVVEGILAAAGFDIVHPEKLSFKKQVRLFSERTHIMACVGSSLHTSVFTPSPNKITIVSGTESPNSNFSLMDQASGNRPTYLFAPGSTTSSDSSGRFLSALTLAEPERIAKDLLRIASRADA